MPAHQGLDPWPLFTAGGSFGREQLHLSHCGDREDDQAEILATEELWHLKSQRVLPHASSKRSGFTGLLDPHKFCLES